MQGNGFLAIWSDVQPHQETDYLHWLTREHTAERVGVPGFLAVRVFRALDTDARRYFILYELEQPEVLAGADYMARLNAPTPWSQRIMPILGNFVRGGGRRTGTTGTGQGSIIAPIVIRNQTPSKTTDTLKAVASLDRIAAVRLLETDNSRTAIQTNEKQLRQNDSSFETMILIEGVDENAVRAALERVANDGIDVVDTLQAGLYAQVFSLDKRHLG